MEEGHRCAEEGRIIVVMGVTGAGKTTVGQALAADLHIPFYDGDDFHSVANKTKMSQGQPLTDADRADWLAALRSDCQQGIANSGVLGWNFGLFKVDC
jgi:gluconokinase